MSWILNMHILMFIWKKKYSEGIKVQICFKKKNMDACFTTYSVVRLKERLFISKKFALHVYT